MIRLVVNADDFGTTPTANLRIVAAHREGIVTSTSLLGNCADLASAREMLAGAPELGVGLALTLVVGPPVASPQDVPSLLTPDGTMRRRGVDFAIDWCKNQIVPEHVEHELDAQITRAMQAGVAVDHLCTRAHLGFLPGVGQIVERLARRHRIAGIRSTVEPPTLGWVVDPRRAAETTILAGLSWLTRRRLGVLRHGPHTWGYLESGRLDEVRIMEIVGRLAPGSHELICHPGDDVETGEFRALVSPKVKDALRRRGIVLSRWRDLF